MDESPARARIIEDRPLSAAEVLALVEHPRAGGVVSFTGLVRDHDGGRGVVALDYSAHPDAAARLRSLVDEVAARPGVVAAAAHHRVGPLSVGDLAVVVAVAAEHRAEAFDGARDLIDRLKAEVPIWKHQRFSDGSDEWVGTP